MDHTSSLTIKELYVKKNNNYTLLQKRYENVTKTNLLDPFTPPVSIDSKALPTVSIIISAWNARETILACLSSIQESSFNILYQDHLQVVIIDDGSTDETWELLKKSHLSLNLKAVRIQHSHRAKACNTGVSVAGGEILLSCDADIVLSYFAIEHLVTGHQLLPNAVLVGFCSNVNPNDLRVNAHRISKHGSHTNTHIIGDERLSFPVPGWPNNMCLISSHYKELGYGRGLWMPDDESYKDPWLLCDQVFGALFSVTKDVFVNVGGYDERFTGWGCEDSFLAAKAIAYEQYVIPIYAASGLHISHPPRSGNKKWDEYEQNRKLFYKLMNKPQIKDSTSWLNQAKKRILDSFEYSPSKKPRITTAINNLSKENEFTLEKIDTLLAIGDYNQTFSLLSEKIEKINNDSMWLLRLARVLFGMDRYQESISIFEQITLNDSPPETALELAIAYASNRDYASAKTILKKLFESRPSTPGLSYWYQRSTESHIMQGRKFLKQGSYDVASMCFEAALIVEPKNKIALKYRNQCIKKKIKNKRSF
ncbi:MAG: glycosyltransferase [Candidatus Heimdallarchaeota archaeon]